MITITSLTKDGQPWGDNQTQTFDIALSNGISGKIYAGVKYYDYYKVGDAVDVVENTSKTDKNGNAYNKLKLKKVEATTQTPSSPSQAPAADHNSFLVKDTMAAVGLMAAAPGSNVTLDNIELYLEKVYNWGLSKQA